MAVSAAIRITYGGSPTGTTSRRARHRDSPDVQRCDTRPASSPPIDAVTFVADNVVDPRSTSTSMWIAVAAGTSRGPSTWTMRTPAGRGVVTVDTNSEPGTGSSGYRSPMT